MPTTMSDRVFDLSGGIQNGTNWMMRQSNEVEDAINGRFGDVIGSIVRRPGYQKVGNVLQSNKNGLGFTEGKWLTGAQILAAINNSGDTETKIKSYDTGSGNWTDITTPDAVDPNTVVQFADSLNETYAAGISTTTGKRMNVLNIVTSDDIIPVIQISKTKNLLNCPKARFITEYGGSLYAINCELGSKVYADRAYKSSPATGVVTYVQGEQIDVDAPVDLIDNVPTMTSDTTPIGVVTASTVFTGFTASGAFSDSILRASSWFTGSGNPTGTLQYDFGAGNAKTITYYSLTPIASDYFTSNPDTIFAPKTWTFEGSNDAISWTVLDTQTNAASFAPTEKRIYSVSNTTAYRYYRINVSANQGGSILTIAEMELLTSSQGTKDLQLKLDSVRYIKQGMTFDVYQAGHPNKLFTINVASVDKPTNTITFTPYSLNFAPTDVTGTGDFALSTTTNFPTGTQIRFSSTGTLPAGLTAGTIYYAINSSPTSIKVASSLANAKLGVSVNITSQGTGTHTIRLSYAVSDNDELWLTGRYGKLTYFWNTDYPTEQAADYLRIPPSVDADSEITGFAQTNNRLFLFTKNSTHKWDGQNFPNVYPDIGCVSHDTIENIGDWIIWLDAEGKVRSRNDSTGQEELISRHIKPLLDGVPESNLLNASAGRIDNMYKLCLGNVNGSVLRLVYDYDTNTWAHDTTKRTMTKHMRSTISGTKKLYFIADNGQMYVDDTGTLDDTDSIPFKVKFGNTMNKTVRGLKLQQKKNYHGLDVYSGNAAGASIKYTIDDKNDTPTVGQIQNNFEKVALSQVKKQVDGYYISVEFSINTEGEAPYVSGIVYYFDTEEDKFGKPTK